MDAGLFLTGARRLMTWASLNVLMLAGFGGMTRFKAGALRARTVAAPVVSEAKLASLAYLILSGASVST